VDKNSGLADETAHLPEGARLHSEDTVHGLWVSVKRRRMRQSWTMHDKSCTTENDAAEFRGGMWQVAAVEQNEK
jgi:hypothetical protein